MKYLALIYGAPDVGPMPGTPEFDALIEAYRAAEKGFDAAGVKLAGEALQPVQTATSIRVRGGKAELTDGPFAETKEQLGGFYLFECDTLDQAIEHAKAIPSAEHGTIELRPVMSFD